MRKRADVTYKFKRSGYKLADGRYNIQIQCYLYGEQIRIGTDVNVLVSEWDDQKQKIKGRSQEARDNQLALDDFKSRLYEIQMQLRFGGKKISKEIFVQMVRNAATRTCFIAYCEWRLEERKRYISFDTYRHEQSNIRGLRAWRETIPFVDINDLLVKEYKYYLREKGNTRNTIATKLKKLLKYLNHAQDDGFKFEFPEKEIKLSETASKVQALSTEQLRRSIYLYQHNELDPHLHHALKLFLFACFTGLRYGDVVALRSSQITEEYLHLVPKKTRHIKQDVIKLKLNDFALSLLNLKRNKPLGEVPHNAVLNRQLKMIRPYLGKGFKLTYHMARHTFATTFLDLGGNIMALKDLLGHSKMDMVLKYQHKVQESMDAGTDNFNQLLVVHKKTGAEG